MAAKMPQLQPLHITNLRDHIEEQVRTAIWNGTFKPGERIVETVIADQLNVSRAPVREALSILERDGIVVSLPRKGYYVTDFTDKDIEEVYEFRVLLEEGALRRAVERFTPHDIARMQAIIEELADAVARNDNRENVIHLDFLFHEHICRCADHSRLYQAWNSMRWQTLMLIGVTSRTHTHVVEQPHMLHQQILDAIVDKDLSRAAAVLTEHIRDAERRARKALKEPVEEVDSKEAVET